MFKNSAKATSSGRCNPFLSFSFQWSNSQIQKLLPLSVRYNRHYRSLIGQPAHLSSHLIHQNSFGARDGSEGWHEERLNISSHVGQRGDKGEIDNMSLPQVLAKRVESGTDKLRKMVWASGFCIGSHLKFKRGYLKTDLTSCTGSRNVLSPIADLLPDVTEKEHCINLKYTLC